MNARKIPAVILIALLAATAAAAQSAVGTIRYMEGDVSVTRDGEVIDSSDIFIGTVIEEFDTLETGPDGYAEVEMDAPSAGSLIRVKSNTAFYFEGTPKKSSWFRTTFQLLRGSLSLKVGRLAAGESYQVQTDTAVMAVRGTEFSVDISTDRSVLVSVPEGKVEGQVGSRRLQTEPGVVTVLNSGASARQIRISPEDLELYRQYWQGLRQDALRTNARMSIQQYSRLWDRDLARLESAMDELTSHEDIFRKWAAIARSGDRDNLPSTGEAIRDKRALSRGMLELRAALPLAERTYETLVGLEEAYHAGYAEGRFNAGSYSDAAAFYRSFNRDKIKVKRMLSTARRMIRVWRAIERVSGQDFSSGSYGIMDGMPTL